MNHASYLVNMSPLTAIILQIPEEIWRGESVYYSTLQFFGCPTYCMVDNQKKNKLKSKYKKCIFIWFTKGVKSFRLCDPKKKSAFTSRDVVFDEESRLREKSEMGDKTKHKVELQTVRQTLKKRKLSSQRALKGLKVQKRTPQIQMDIDTRLLKSYLDR